MSIENSHRPVLQRLSIGDLPLEGGGAIEDCWLGWTEHGLADPDAPVAVALCAIGSNHERMEFLMGPGLPLDTTRLRILCINALGNGLCSSPSNSRTQAASHFPRFTIRDMVASQSRLLDQLGIGRLDLVAGASMGGMQALQWGVSHPDRMARIVALSPLAKTPGWTAAVNELARRALQAAPDTAHAWESWTLVMQLLAVRTPQQVNAEIADAASLPAWLEKRAREWASRGFAPLDWVYQSLAYDAHDVGTTAGFHGDTQAALASIRARTLVLTAGLDLYNPGACAQWAAGQIPDCTYAELDSDWGHFTFSAADTDHAALLRQHISQFLWASEGNTKP